jgi:hypothetical protein
MPTLRRLIPALALGFAGFHARADADEPAQSGLSANPLRVEAVYAADDNLNRARGAGEKLADEMYSLSVSRSASLPLTAHTRLLLTGFVSGEKLRRTRGLDRVSGGVQGELQYRASGEFDAPTLGVFARVAFDEYRSELRSGQRSSVGVNLRRPLTDRIELYAALAGNSRRAGHAVFDARDYAARVSLDYSLGREGAVYLGGEYRRGDTVTTVPDSPLYEDIARALVADDAYAGRGLVAYRYTAKAVLWTLGYNRALGPDDSIDFSWRRAESTPTSSGATGLYGPAGSYRASQYWIAYLVRF